MGTGFSPQLEMDRHGARVGFFDGLLNVAGLKQQKNMAQAGDSASPGHAGQFDQSCAELFQIGVRWRLLQAGGRLQFRPGFVFAKDFQSFVAVVVGKVFKCGVRLRVRLEGFEMLDELGTEVVEIRFDVPKHMFAGDFFKADAATGREVWKTRLDFANDIEAVLAEECFEFAVDPIAFVEMPNEIQNSEAFLAWVQAQASPELLEKNRQAIRGPEE